MASIAKRPDDRWRARYRDGASKEHARHFRRRTDAQQWLDQEITKQQTGSWIAPRAAKMTVEEWCKRWLDGYRTRKSSTVRMAEVILPRSSWRSGRGGWTRSDLRISKAGWCSCRPSMPRVMSTRCMLGWRRYWLMPSTMECWRAIRALVVRRRAPALSGLTWPRRGRSGLSMMRWGSTTALGYCWRRSLVCGLLRCAGCGFLMWISCAVSFRLCSSTRLIR
jgi:hypothetical protein